MNKHLPSTLKSLSNWTDKFITETNAGSWTVNKFLDSYNTDEYFQFYSSLMPFVDQLSEIQSGVNANLKNEFHDNYERLTNELTISRISFGDIFGGNWPFQNGRSLGDAILILKDIKNNCENILYQLDINS